MDINDLFLSCKRGDLQRVKFHVEQKEIELNVRDKWDSTPLYYACLCGHFDLVQYMLENGARCEANTFDGERCLYGALNPQIRNLLRTYKVITPQFMRRDSYEEFLRRLFESNEYADVKFDVNGHHFLAHRCILSARCDYFCEMFQTRWRNKSCITIANSLVTPEAFKAILQYLYTGRLETQLEQADECIRLAKQCQLPLLVHQIEDTVSNTNSFACTKPGTNVTTMLLEPSIGSSDLQDDFGILVEQGLPLQFCNWVRGNELPFSPSVERSFFFDLSFSVEGHNFFCHKAFVCGRSDYFKALLRDHFHETAVDEERNLPVITLQDVSANVFLQIMYYMYQNAFEMSLNTVFDVLQLADMYFLQGMKRQCGAFLGQNLDVDNVVSLIRTSRLFELPRLEDLCTEYVSKNLEVMIEDQDFHQLIMEDAKMVQEREETDSISVIDDIRYHLASNVQTYSGLSEVNDHLRLIDDLLDMLGLDA